MGASLAEIRNRLPRTRREKVEVWTASLMKLEPKNYRHIIQDLSISYTVNRTLAQLSPILDAWNPDTTTS